MATGIVHKKSGGIKGIKKMAGMPVYAIHKDTINNTENLALFLYTDSKEENFYGMSILSEEYDQPIYAVGEFLGDWGMCMAPASFVMSDIDGYIAYGPEYNAAIYVAPTEKGTDLFENIPSEDNVIYAVTCRDYSIIATKDDTYILGPDNEIIDPNGIVPKGTMIISNNGSHDVTEYANVSVQVPIGITPVGTYNISTNGMHNIAQYEKVNVQVPSSGIDGITLSPAIFKIDMDTILKNEPEAWMIDTIWNEGANSFTIIRNSYFTIGNEDRKDNYSYYCIGRYNADTKSVGIGNMNLFDSNFNYNFTGNGQVVMGYTLKNQDFSVMIDGELISGQKGIAFRENDKTYIFGYSKTTNSIFALEDGKDLLTSDNHLGDPIPVNNEAAADALMIPENNNKIFRYTGPTGKYEKDTLYLIEVN